MAKVPPSVPRSLHRTTSRYYANHPIEVRVGIDVIPPRERLSLSLMTGCRCERNGFEDRHLSARLLEAAMVAAAASNHCGIA